MKIALVGNPNSGKTTLFNALTGSAQYVGNWPGVTVEKKEGKLKKNKEVSVMDLPGIYSLSPYTPEEIISRNYILQEAPDVILNIVDATNLERNLYLTTQLIESGIPVVIALNMMDVIEKNKDIIDVELLEKRLGCKVVKISAIKQMGVTEATEIAIVEAKKGKDGPALQIYSKELNSVLESIEQIIKSEVSEKQARFYAVKLFEKDEKITDVIKLDDKQKQLIEKIVTDYEDLEDDDGESIITNERYLFISGIIKKGLKKTNQSGLTLSDKIDQIVTNRILALPIFALVMFLVYYVSISTVGTAMTDWVNDVLFGEIIPPAVEGFLVNIGTSEWLISLINDGIIAGVGAVLGFLPQMLTLFFFLAILEDCGYMSRIAFIMDRIFKRFGLSGKSFIPMLIGTGCSVPGIMASRTIESERDRRMTIITTSFIPCSAKLPIIALIAGALFPGSSWVAPSAYFIGVVAVVISGIILKKFKLFVGDPSPFVMELPAYHMPRPKGVLMQMYDKGKSFVVRAGTIILVSSVVLWFLASFSFGFEMVDVNDSILATLGNIIAPIFTPIGWGDWRAAVATITGLIAKENVVATFGVLFRFAGEVSEDGTEIWPQMQMAFSQLSAFSFLIFNLLCVPCFAAVGAIKREMGSSKMTWFAIGYQTALAYAVSLVVYQLGTFFAGGEFGFGTIVAILILVCFIYLLARPASKGKGMQKKKTSA